MEPRRWIRPPRREQLGRGRELGRRDAAVQDLELARREALEADERKAQSRAGRLRLGGQPLDRRALAQQHVGPALEREVDPRDQRRRVGALEQRADVVEERLEKRNPHDLQVRQLAPEVGQARADLRDDLVVHASLR